jgi:hypothetical protein
MGRQSWRRNVTPHRRFIYEPHKAMSQKRATFTEPCFRQIFTSTLRIMMNIQQAVDRNDISARQIACQVSSVI